jgi:GNAT superfamily N-acetyltransferase
MPAGQDGEVRIEPVAYAHPDAAALVAEVQREYAARYGSEDDSPAETAEFTPPRGLFLVGYLGGQAVACGGWRSHGRDAEVRRMFVTPAARGRGWARAILAELERTALAAGHHRMILETGSVLPEAVALYRSAGYSDIPAFGYYAGAPLSIHLGKALPPG